MRKVYLILGMLLFSANPVLAESVTLSTYYPAPFGIYDRLQLVPRNEIFGACNVGTFYTRDTDNALRFCKDTGGGPLAGSWGPMTGIWERNGASIYLIDTDTVDDFRVGIGDLTPEAVLEVSSSNQGYDLFMLSTDDNTDGDLLTVKSDGRVGIGTNNPSTELHVDAGTADDIAVFESTDDTAYIRIGDDDTDAYITAKDNMAALGTSSGLGVNNLQVSNTGDVAIGGNVGVGGNVAIGDVSDLGIVPAQKLNVRGSINLRDDGTNWGPLKVQYDAGTQAYYAVYAP